MSPKSDPDERQAVSDAIDELNHAERRLEQRQLPTSLPTAIERSAVRFVFERAVAQAVTPSELAAHLGISRSSVTKLVGRLRRAGLVTQRPHPSDRRSKLVLPADGADGEDPLPESIRRLVGARDGGDARIISGFLEELRDVIDREDPRPRRAR